MAVVCRRYSFGMVILVALGACAAPGPGPDTLANSEFGEGTRVGVVVYVGGNNVVSSTGEISFVNQKGRTVETRTIVAELAADIDDPAPELGPFFADLLSNATGVAARPIVTTLPRGNPGAIAKREGPSHGVDAILFIPLVGTTYFTPSEREDGPLAPVAGTAEIRHELVVYARLWNVDGMQLWEGELGRSNRRFGGYLAYASSDAIATEAEFFEQLRTGFDGYLESVRETGMRIVADLAEDTSAPPAPSEGAR